MTDKPKHYDRRFVSKTVIIGGIATAILLPSKWTRPIVNSIVVPAHAVSSAPPLTTTTTTTTGAPVGPGGPSST